MHGLQVPGYEGTLGGQHCFSPPGDETRRVTAGGQCGSRQNNRRATLLAVLAPPSRLALCFAFAPCPSTSIAAHNTSTSHLFPPPPAHLPLYRQCCRRPSTDRLHLQFNRVHLCNCTPSTLAKYSELRTISTRSTPRHSLTETLSAYHPVPVTCQSIAAACCRIWCDSDATLTIVTEISSSISSD